MLNVAAVRESRFMMASIFDCDEMPGCRFIELSLPWSLAYDPSSTDRIVLASWALSKGFCRSATPGSRTLCWTTLSSV